MAGGELGWDRMALRPEGSDGEEPWRSESASPRDGADARWLAAAEALASARSAVEDVRLSGTTDEPAIPAAAVQELEAGLRELLREARRIIHTGVESLPGADGEALVLAGDALVADVLGVRATLEGLIGRGKEATEARRREGMVRGYVSGEMLRSTGERYGVSPQRVHQIVSRYGVRRVPKQRQ